MSLVTTARSYSAPSVRHSAAASAVLPEPTGPPRPTRSGPPCRCGARASVWSRLESFRLWSGGKEPVLPCGVQLGEQVEERVGGRRQPGDGGLGGDRIEVRSETGGEWRHGERVHRQQPLGRSRRATDRQVGGRCGGV